ncbi:zonadhesin-like isoform X3 [Leguminivora glycinivorella]|uniref:zonadhesin-like isoform X3 n=1 Tax=Leguminivora glycinivorella TaxID=1035111 RepID=UPI00200F580C|nr:zonadhesin-like isoform X3 [Leguminivora glycinivorella]
MVALIILVVVGVGVSATSPKKPKETCTTERHPVDPVEPIKCGPNSHFEKCSKICPPYDCQSLIDPYWMCGNGGCKPECRCNDGFYRQNGTCISTAECLAQCGPLERYVSDSTDCQLTCANYKVTAPRSLCKPFSGCVCADGRVRLNDDATGPCVLPKDCPSRPCPLHEHWEDCPSVCANETCISKSPTYKCLLPAIPLPCKGRCICDKGYLRNHFGDCVPKNHCPIKECPINEVWRCASMCPRDSCKRLEPGFQCPPGIISVCIPACECKDGYLRDDHGICIPRDLCPASLRCDINEAAVECLSYPPPTCESVYTLYKPIDDAPCNPGCECRPGYLRNKRNICVPSEFCPTVPYCGKCGPNQEYKKCGTRCEPSCSDLDKRPQVCADVCVKGCFCKEGFLKDEHGNCVYPSECPLPVCNKPNEVAKACGSYCEKRTCENYNRTDIVCPAVCVRGCFCRKGYVRNAYGVCIHPKKCPSKPVCLQEHEVYQPCGSSCPDNCDNYMNTNRICTQQCVAACNCKKGYVRNLKDGTCIKPEQCPTKECTGINEDLNYCASYCPVTCANRFTQGDWSCITLCREACDCIPGTLRNDTGSCVPVSQCTPPICRDNEKYMKCGTACPLTCDNYKNPPKHCTHQCIEDCFCKDGYVRNRYGRCVKPEDCEPTCPTGEKWNECSAHCQDTCENYHSSNRSCTYQCQSGCVCETGTVRRKDGKCVKPTECTDPIICPVDEEYDPCSAHCEPTCDNHGPDRACTAICKPGCKCCEGLVRRKDGKCVKLKDCPPPICRKNEKYMKCGTACPLTCDNYKNPPKHCTHQCIEDCFCKDGYVRNRFGRCVKPVDCEPTCPTGEKWNECSAHCQDTCENYHSSNRSCTYQCQSGCVCETGTVRRKDGKCVKPTKCTPPICRENEKYMKCGTACPLTCDNYKNPPKHCTHQCIEDCFCKDGYVRNRFGRCVKPVDCEHSCPTGEKWNECSAHCQDTCENYHSSNRICTHQCQSGCVCETGTVRRKDGKCVKPTECNGQCPSNEVYDPCSNPPCPPGKSCAQVCIPACRCKDGLVRDKHGKCVNPHCPVNERWVDCVIALCIALTCDELGFPIACPGIIGPCDGGCVCAENYVRDRNGVCIPKQNCPSCNNDFNATSGCGIHCGRQCTDYKNPPPCNSPMPCNFNGCDCKKGYVYDIVTGRCLAPCDCPVLCNGDLYAERVKCPNPCPATCANPTHAICSRLCLREGCQCRPGYVLNPDGKCVSPENCPDNIGCNGDPNAQISSCVSLCEPKCGVNPVFCPASCHLGCRCKTGFILSQSGGKCIKPENCVNATTSTTTTTEAPCKTRPPRETNSTELILCPNNEIWIDCKAGYCKPQYCRDLGRLLTCPKVCHPCPGGCICRKGLLRNDDGVCIPEKECPINQPCSDPNAIRKKCAVHESCKATCAVPNSKVCPKICIINGCECKQGYVLSGPRGICIKIEDCPKGNNVSCNGDPNAEIMAFPPPCPSTCKLPNGLPGCKKLGPDVGCVCKPGYIKDDHDKCILPKNCPGGNPCGANETFVSCKIKDCPKDYCPVDDNSVTMICDPVYPCPSGCVCKLNYKRKSQEDQRCILSSDCPPVECTRPNEVWNPCPSACLRENCDDINDQPTTCNTLVHNCDPRCICTKGHFRNASGICVPAKECPINQPCSDPNAIRKKCALHESCKATCAVPNSKVCPKICIINGCECKPGYVLSGPRGICIKIEDCPKGNNVSCNGDPNAEIMAFPPPCPSTCKLPNGLPGCLKLGPDVGCVCKPGYIKDDHDKCILPKNCPGGNPCGANETFVSCKIKDCPKDYCPVDDNSVTMICDPVYPCPSGCVCKLNYKRKSKEDDRCICSSDCPPVECTRPNEVWNPCPSACLRENCDDVNDQPTTCNTLVHNCDPRCICTKGHFRNASGICIPAKKCPINQPCSDPNAIRKKCAVHESCKATCAVPNSKKCPKICIINGCECKPGYVLSGPRGICIKIEDCPKGNNVSCNGDPNAEIMAFPPPCPSTCKLPNGLPGCKKFSPDVGCVCKPGYIKDDHDKCILPKNCPGGNPCGANETFVSCKIKDCPKDYCPVDDNSVTMICDPVYPCPSGCVCKLNYKRKSKEDDRCILSSDCPPVECTRPNEVWNPCPSACLRENCDDVNDQPTTCNTLVHNCDPRCICTEGHFRNASGICVPAEECPNFQPKSCDDPNAERVECAPDPSCRSTCSTPNPSKPCKLNCAIDNCVCKRGFVLSKKGGKCIPVNQCPKDKPCNGDSNAYIIANPPPCPSTCDSPNASYFCRRAAPPVACQCKDGLIKATYDGKCIKPDECPGGNPCGANETFVSCKIKDCPKDYCPVDDNSVTMICDPVYPCPSGCVCKLNYKRKSKEDDRCICSSDCPPVECTRPNEVWNPCPSACLRENCDDVNDQPITCNTLVHNCDPRCICTKGHFRNASGICIPAKKCPINQPCSDPNAIRKKCAVHESCKATCAVPNSKKCPKICIINGCECKPGYVLSGPRGICIKIEDCPSGNPCGANETFVSCKIKDCPKDYCPVDDNSVTMICDPVYPCPSGCVCKLNYKRKSKEDDRCILSSDCPPVECTRPNEVWNPCPSACLRENCDDVNDQPTTCNTLVHNCDPRCICTEGHFRNASGICVPAEECPNFQPKSCDDPNAERVECAPDPSCRSTCSTPNPSKPCKLNCAIDNCVCKRGFVLSKKGGKCIPVNQCPKDKPCNGDSNAYVIDHPSPCPSTCDSPNASYLCRRAAPPVACQCKDGLIKATYDRKCIKPDECPGGNPCGKNATFVPCSFICPSNECPGVDNTALAGTSVACLRPDPCPSGCKCKKGYTRRSSSDYTCILPSDCPNVQPKPCDDPNAERVECAPDPSCRSTCSHLTRRNLAN